MLLFPFRVEDATVRRLPWMSIAIAATWVVMFALLWEPPWKVDLATSRAEHGVVKYWYQHPYLALPPRLLERLDKDERDELAARHARAQEALPEDPDQVASEQRELDGRVDALIRQLDADLKWRLSMVPSRGFLQAGLVTHLFLHFELLTLLGNLLFFYIAALLLEDRWGRAVFAGFYLVSGMVAAAAQYALDAQSNQMMGTASGAVAACTGAFALRFPTRRVEMAYWIGWLWRGTFLISAWMFGAGWFLLQLINSFLDDGSSGVAFAAHLAGFGFGAGVAIALKASGLEERFLAPAVEQEAEAGARPAGMDAVEAAIARGDAAAVKKELEAVLARAPDAVNANVMLIELELGSNPAGAHARAERFLARLLSRESPEAVDVVEKLAPALDLSRLRPTTAFRMGQALDRGPDGLRPLAEKLFAAAAREPGPFAVKALLRAAQARLDANGEARGALEYLEKLRAISGVQPDQQARAAELEQRAQDVLAREREVVPRFTGKGIDLEEAPAPPPPPPPPFAAPEALAAAEAPAEPSRSGAKVVECQLGGMTREALSLVLAGGGQAQVSLSGVLAVAVAVAAEPAPPPAPPRQVLYTDLVTSWGGPSQPAQVLRLKSSTLKLHNFYPGMKPQEAFGLFLAHVLDQSGATGLPDSAALRRGQYPRYPDVESFTRALYG